MERDGANIYVLEGIILSMILLGAAYAVSTLQDSSLENVRPRAALDQLANDALAVLAGLDDGNGTKLLDLYLLEAIHCASDEVPSDEDCDMRRSQNLSLKIENYLPLGGGYSVAIGNGAATREIYRSPLPQGEAVSSTRHFTPAWNTTFAYTDFSCYPAGVGVNLTLIPLDRGNNTWSHWASAIAGNVEYTAERASTPPWWDEDMPSRWWNVTLPHDTRPVEGNVRTNASNHSGDVTFPGLTSYADGCSFDLTTNETLRSRLWDVDITPAARSVPVGESVGFTVDLGPIEATGVTINGATLTVYEALPTTPQGPDTWIPTGNVVSFAGPYNAPVTGTYTPSITSFYGTHPALLRVSVTSGLDTFELRKATLLDIALASGEVPIEPPYRISLQAWLADWG